MSNNDTKAAENTTAATAPKSDVSGTKGGVKGSAAGTTTGPVPTVAPTDATATTQDRDAAAFAESQRSTEETEARAKAEAAEAKKAPAKTVKEDAKTRNDGAVEGARSVADAISRVTDEIISSVERQELGELPEVLVTGGTDKGNQFVLNGSGFGASGTVTVNGQQCFTSEWGPTRIVGTLPAKVENGDEVVIHVDSETQKVGHFGPQRRAAKKSTKK